MPRKRASKVATSKTPNLNAKQGPRKLEPVVLEPKTSGQADFIRTIAENDLTICDAIAGTGKTTISVGMACSYFLDGKVEKIILCRPLAQCGPGAGFLPGTIETKSLPFMHPMMDALDMFLGDSVHRYISEKKIIISPLETLRGGNLHNSFIILDEMQNASYSQLKMLGPRIGKFSKAVFVGDMSQSDVDNFRFNNTADIQKNFFDRLKGQNGTIGFSTLGPEDIIRSRLAKIIAINCP